MNRDDFGEWYESSYAQVAAAVAVQVGEVGAAREATDEAFVRALERWDSVREMPERVGWVYRVAINVARREARRRTRERSAFERLDRGEAVPLGVGDPELWEAVRSLPDRQREAVVLRYLLDLPQHEIGVAMGIAAGTVAGATLNQARGNLGQALGVPVSVDEETSDV